MGAIFIWFFIYSVIPLYLVGLLIAYFFFHHILSPKKPKRYIKQVYIITYFIFYTLQYFIFLFHNRIINIIFIVCNLIIILLCYKSKFHTALFYSFLLYALMNCSKISVLLIYEKTDVKDLFSDLYLTMVDLNFIISNILYFILAIILVNIIQCTQKKPVLNFSPFCIAIEIITLIFFYQFTTILQKTTLDSLAEKFFLLSLVLILIINIILFWLQKYIQEYIQAYIQYKQQQVYELEIKLQQEIEKNNIQN